MITFHAARERQHDRRGSRQTWLTSFPALGPTPDGLGAAPSFAEVRLQPGARMRAWPPNAETIHYVREGSLTWEKPSGQVSVLHTGEFSLTRASHGVRHTMANASRTTSAQVFHIGLRSASGPQPELEQTRFCTAQRRGRLCLVASPDGREGSLRVRDDARVYAAVLDRGHHVVHELPPGEGAWLHVVRGEVTLAGRPVTIGGSVGVVTEPAISFTAGDASEILLLRVTL